jgi:predicted DsbA family dithiol-disulfide isomerase
MQKIDINYSSDLLCVWAYVSQARVDELLEHYAERVNLEYSFLPVFGNAHEKLDSAWREKGGRAAYARHVHDIVARFGHLPIAPQLWLKDAPTSSLPAHLHVCAARLLEQRGALEAGTYAALTWRLRHAFFAEGVDISRRANIAGVIEQQGIPRAELDACIESGEAYAMLSEQTRVAFEAGIKVSPTLTFNEGRQRLSGNVGYRIIEANIRELIERPELKQSWC